MEGEQPALTHDSLLVPSAYITTGRVLLDENVDFEWASVMYFRAVVLVAYEPYHAFHRSFGRKESRRCCDCGLVGLG